MERLLHSSKFWALAIGAVGLVASALVGDGQVSDIAKNLVGIYAVVAPIVYAVMTGLEDVFADGQVTLDEVLELLKDLLNEKPE